MRELCGSRTDACSGISPGPLCPRNLQGGRTIQAHWSFKWNDDVGKLNVIWLPRHNNNNKSTIPTNWHRLVTYSGCVFVESQGVGGHLLSATGETIKEPLPADLTLTSWFSEEEQERFRFPRVTLMNVAWRQNDTHTHTQQSGTLSDSSGLSWSNLKDTTHPWESAPSACRGHGSNVLQYNLVKHNAGEMVR